MIRILHKTMNAVTVAALDELPDDGSAWVDVVAPSERELEAVSASLQIDCDVLRAALDDEELPRIEVDDDYLMMILDVPQQERDMENVLIYQTYPLGIVHTPRAFVTVRLYEGPVLDRFIRGNYKGFSTLKRSRFTLQIVREIAATYIGALRDIDQMSDRLELSLRKSIRNRELIQMLSLGKSLVYISTSLKANQGVLRRMARSKVIVGFEEDAELLEDALIETEQAMEMADIYTNIVNSTMDALASVISNNLNAVMKVLTSAAIVMAVPTIIGGWFGMNVADIPIAEANGAFWWVVLASLSLAGAVALWLHKRDLL